MDVTAAPDLAPGTRPGHVARFVTTIINPEHPGWEPRATMLDRDALSIPALIHAIVREGRRHDAALLLGAVPARGGYADLIAAGRLARQPDPPLVVLSECTWEPGSASLAAALDRVVPGLGSRMPLEQLTRRAIRAMDGPRVVYCVLSEEDRRSFIPTWGVPPERVVVTRFGASLPEEILERPGRRGDYVFAGGDPLRDYDLLAEASRGLGAEVHVATRRWRPDPSALPPNVHAGALAHEEFVERLAGCGVVVVPMAGGRMRSAGQQTFLNAMALGKPVVISDAVGVREYVTDREHALVVPTGDAREMHRALAWVLDPANGREVDAMVDRARALVDERFRFSHYEGRLMAVVDEYLELLGRPAEAA